MAKTKGKRQALERSPECLCTAPKSQIHFISLESFGLCLNLSSPQLLQSIQLSKLLVQVHCVPANSCQVFSGCPNVIKKSEMTEIVITEYLAATSQRPCRTSVLISGKFSTVLPLILLLFSSLSDLKKKCKCF